MKKVFLTIVLALSSLYAPIVSADTPLKSTNYQIAESIIGGGGLTNATSTNYQTSQSIGGPTVGSSDNSNPNYQTKTGYSTTSEPALTLVVSSGNLNFSNISNTSTSTANSTFSVIDYTSYGYNIYVSGSPPSSSTHTLTSMFTPGVSQVGTEQFGMNLRQNTDPNSPHTAIFGADPSGGLGSYATGYGTVNTYQYGISTSVPTSLIASSPASSGQTNFTASYIVNASPTTNAGTYSGSISLICIGTY
jgi:hypothetical protein